MAMMLWCDVVIGRWWSDEAMTMKLCSVASSSICFIASSPSHVRAIDFLQSEGTSFVNRGNELQYSGTRCVNWGSELQSEGTSSANFSKANYSTSSVIRHGCFLISVQLPIPIKMTVFVDQATHSSDGQISKLLTQSHSTWLTSSNILLLNIFNVIP